MFKEFTKFAMRGNVLDLAVGIIIGAAFGKIINSLVSDLIMPVIGFLISGTDFKALKLTLIAATESNPGVTITYGNFIQTVFEFLVIAFSIFLMVKAVSNIRKKFETEEEKKVEAPKGPTQEELLVQIRDLLKNK